jgi:hypothetical protein
MVAPGRWPPIYDANQLQKLIRDLVATNDLAMLLYAGSINEGGLICQGDIVRMPCSLPFVDEDCEPSTTEVESEYWLVVGNTRDFDRDIATIPWTQVVPIDDRTPTAEQLDGFVRYKPSRTFFLPPWEHALGGKHFTADLATPATVHKKALLNHGQVVARLSRQGWVLLHSCLVRFLCRDDGRFD